MAVIKVQLINDLLHPSLLCQHSTLHKVLMEVINAPLGVYIHRSLHSQKIIYLWCTKKWRIWRV